MLVSGFQTEMENRMLSVYPHISFHHSEDSLPSESIDGLVAVESELLGWSTSTDALLALVANNQVTQSRVIGIDPATFDQVSDLSRFTQRDLSESIEAGAFKVVVGKQIARRLDLEVGDELQVFNPNFKVTPLGVIPQSKRFKVSDIVDTESVLDNLIVYVHREDLAKMVGVAKIGNRILFRAKDPLELRGVVYIVADTLRLQHSIRLSVSTWSSMMGVQYSFLKVIENVFFLLLSLLVAVASFNLVSTMIMMVHERQSDIAILRTIGAKTWLLTTTFTLTAGLIALIGISLGALLSWILGYALEWIFPWIVELMSLDEIDVIFIRSFEMRFQIADFLKVFLVGSGLAMLGALYPAYRVSKLLPSDVLRYE